MAISWLPRIYLHESEECKMTYKVLSCDTPLKGVTQSVQLSHGEVTLPAIQPGETGTAHFDLPDNFHEGDVLELEAFDKKWT